MIDINNLIKGDRRTLAKAITLLESTKDSDRLIAQTLLDQALPHSGKSFRLGITGVPGVGKSSFIETFGQYLIEKGHKVAVLAVDPSSPINGGSIMGDKTRMEKLSQEPNAFIRPSPTSGSLGGVSHKTREAALLCEAAGFDTVFVETVGVGQSEIAVHSMVDFFLLIQLAGTGDELQGIKRGIMEMADGIAINKCDGSNVDKANVAKVQFKNALHLFPTPDSGWTPEVITCSATEGTGISEVWQMVENQIDFVKKNQFFEIKRNSQSKYWMYETINEALKNNFYRNEEIQKLLIESEHKVLTNQISSFIAANNLLNKYLKE